MTTNPPSAADRAAAQRALADHRTAGRITSEEYVERLAQVQEATSADAMHAVFADLPGGLPTSTGSSVAPQPGLSPQPSPGTSTPAPTREWPTLPLGGTPGFHSQSPYRSMSDPYADLQRNVEHQELMPQEETEPLLPGFNPPAAQRRQWARTLSAFTSWPVLIFLAIVFRSWWIILLGIFVIPVIISALNGDDRPSRDPNRRYRSGG